MSDGLYPLRFEPVLKRYIWGGRRLETVLGKSLPPGDDYAESWEIADHRDGMSVVANGALKGTSLHALLERQPRDLLGGQLAGESRFPLLIKFLDAHEKLSVQVHPDDALAARLVDDRGKTEAWVVLDVARGSMIYAGLNQGVSRASLERAFDTGEVEPLLHRFEPRVGDCVFLPAGTVHALGGGIVVAEVQQSSNATFRIYDWGRVAPDGRPRPLHRAEALQAIDERQGIVGPVEPLRQVQAWGTRERLVECQHFTLDRWSLNAATHVGSPEFFTILIGVSGEATCFHRGERYPLARGQTLLLPAAVGACEVAPGPGAVLLTCTPGAVA